MPRILKQNKEVKHEEIIYPCSLGEYAATTAGRLKLHKVFQHEGTRYHCGQCDLIFLSQATQRRKS